MNVNKINQSDYQIRKENNTNNSPEFKGVVDNTFRFLATNQAIGANMVDLCFMVIPRTASDWSRRGPVAGLETGRREASGTVNHTLVGVYGITAGSIVALLTGLNRKYGVRSNKILSAPETVNILAENKAAQIQNKESQLDYIKTTLRKLKAFNPEHVNNVEGFVNIGDEAVESASKILDEAITKMPNMKKKFFGKDPLSQYIDAAVHKITESTGVQTTYHLESIKDAKTVSKTDLKTALEDICRVSDAFNSDKVRKAFDEQLKSGKPVTENEFIKKLSRFKKIKSVAGFLIAAGIGASIQPLNMYLTKKKTGQDGFVGVEGRSKNDSIGFKLSKVAAGAGFFAMVLKTLGTGLKGFMDKMAFKGFWPTIDQLKGVYGITIISRLLSARDFDELRESLTKDLIGFLSWLVLGNIVNRFTAELIDKSVMNRTGDAAKRKTAMGRAFHSELKTRDEILIETLAKQGVSTTKEKDGKVVAKTFREMRKDLKNIADETVKKTANKRLKTLNWAQFAGYMFSGLVLGLGIPNLNIWITNTLDKKRKAKASAQSLNGEV